MVGFVEVVEIDWGRGEGEEDWPAVDIGNRSEEFRPPVQMGRR